ncbi:hypothetical protein [Henriciella pelagia]|uniref:hypothetical protein n=1 Tax=Henriciella pelagia TaxID=1977912 RepID=UPI00351715C0
MRILTSFERHQLAKLSKSLISHNLSYARQRKLLNWCAADLAGVALAEELSVQLLPCMGEWMPLFADDPSAIYRSDNPPLPDRPAIERGFTFLDFVGQSDRPVKVDTLGASPLVVHRLVGPDGRVLGSEMYGITLEPGGQLLHIGRLYFTRLDAAIDMADRIGELGVNWLEGEYPDRDQLDRIRSWWRVAHLQGDIAAGDQLPANWPPLPGGDGGVPAEPEPA